MKNNIKVSINLKNWIIKSTNNIGYILNNGNCKIIIKGLQTTKQNNLNLEYINSKSNIPIFNLIKDSFYAS